MFRRWLLACLAAAVCAVVRGQYYSTGADPLSVRWGRVDGTLWSVYADTAARCWASLAGGELGRVAPLLYADFPAAVRRRPVAVVTHSRAAYSNGLVSWAPKRLEAYAYDIGDDDCVPWVRHLMTHEYRHVVQTQSVVTGFSRGLYWLFGEQSVGLVLGLFVPRWALEGDAVWAETNHTPGGRGRNALFLQQMRAQALERGVPSYSQAYFDSYAWRLPDFYHMGYTIVDAVSDSLGNGVWGRALEDVGRKPFTFVPFARSLRRQAGMRPMALYEWSMRRRLDRWRGEAAARGETPAKRLWRAEADYEEVLHPRPWGDKWVAYVVSPARLSHFAVFDAGGRELGSIVPSARNEERFALCGDTIVWSERRQHGRWANASESCLMAACLADGRRWRLTRGGDYHGPAVSPDGSGLAAVVSGRDMSHSVVVGRWGGVLEPVVRMPVGWQVPEVVWLSADTLAAVVVTDRGRGVVSFAAGGGGAMRTLVEPSFRGLRDLAPGDGEVFFAADSCGYSDVYSLSLRGGEVRRRLVARHGARCPVRVGSGLAVSLYGAEGYGVAVAERLDTVLCGVERGGAFVPPADTAGREEMRRVGPVRLHLLPNVHSWGPAVVDAGAQTVRPGVSVASQDVHGTVSLQAGVDLSPDADDERLFATATWDWLWPRLSFSGKWGYADYRQRAQYVVADPSAGGRGEVCATLTVDDRSYLSNLSFSASLPLTRNSGAWLRALTPYASFRRERATGVRRLVTLTPLDGDGVLRAYAQTTPDSKYLCATYGLSAHIRRRAAERDVGSRGGVALSLLCDAAPWEGDYGGLLYGSLVGYLPGFGRHHQLTLTVAAQQMLFGSVVSTSSGLSYRRSVAGRIASPYGLARRTAKTSALFRVAYALPLVNPDWQWGPVAYVKRVNMRLVGDYGLDRLWNGMSVYSTSGRASASAELWAETRWLLLPYPVSVGCRLTCAEGGVSAAALLSVSFQ